jgi:hypothetical protein
MSQEEHRPDWQSFEVLFSAARGGDDRAMDALMRAFEGLVWREVATVDFFAPGLEREDLLQCARLALLDAFRCFQRAKGCNFPSFARVCIRRGLITAVKCARAKKNFPGTMSLDEQDHLAVDAADCEALAIANVVTAARWTELRARLTPLELQVLEARLRGEVYKRPDEQRGRCADNARVRIQRKLCHWLEEGD